MKLMKVRQQFRI